MHNKKVENVIGNRYGRFTVLSDAEPRKRSNGQNRRAVLCQCDCGVEKIVVLCSLKNSTTQSCGCYGRKISLKALKKSNTKHGMTGTRFYRIWKAMRTRSTDPKTPINARYLKLGIRSSVGWEDFVNFRNDMYESYLEHIEEFGENQTSLDRIDNYGNYTNKNCRWATLSEQRRNTDYDKFEVFGKEKKRMSEWAKEYNINQNTVRSRLYQGMNIEEALTIPVRPTSRAY